MEIGLGELRLHPSAFWNMTLHELQSAHEGYRKSHGVEEEPDMPTLDGDDLHELLK